MIVEQLSKINAVSDKDICDDIGRLVDDLTPEQIDDFQSAPYQYGSKIKAKIESLLMKHRKKNFDLWIEQGKIVCEQSYEFPKTISPAKTISILPKSLYTEEEEMNGLERDIVFEIANLSNIKWWHRNISRSGFSINGYVNAYPDVIAMTHAGKILLVEPKGDQLENAESRQKVEIGRMWQNKANMAGDIYRYYMVFRNKQLDIDGAVHMDQFIEIVRGL
jgi:type III restriction enzyme